jgi:spermidine synthase
VALSLGYYFGGRYADKHPSTERFFFIIFISGILVALSLVLNALLLPVLGTTLPITYGPLLSSLLLFFVPALFLGTLSPYVVKILSLETDPAHFGALSGLVFFWSTLGSITGSLSAGFVLVPLLGLNAIIIWCSISLFVLGIGGVLYFGDKKKIPLLVCLAVAVSIVLFVLAGNIKNDALFTRDGVYEKITVRDMEWNGHPARFLIQDRSSSAAVYLDSDEYAFDYVKYMELSRLLPETPKRILVLGAGAYTMPRIFRNMYPDARIDVVDIEPYLEKISEEYFGFVSDENIYSHVTDGRRFLFDSDGEYDFIFVDVYHSLYSIPSHFVTKEFFSLAKSKLSPDGLFMANIIGALGDEKPPSILWSVLKTFKNVFENSEFFAVYTPSIRESQNFIFVGQTDETKLDLMAQARLQSDIFFRALSITRVDIKKEVVDAHILLTDNYAPVEYLTSKLFLELEG